MKNKRIVLIFSIIFIVVLIGGYFIIKYVKENKQETISEEYVPQEEITEEQYRQTIVSLYFVNKETKKVVPEARLVDIKEIINNPYEKILELLIEGPRNEKLESLIPKDTKILKTYMEDDCLTIDVSSEFLNYDKNNKDNLINSIVNSLTELTEVNQVKIIVNGEQNQEFTDIYQRKSS